MDHFRHAAFLGQQVYFSSFDHTNPRFRADVAPADPSTGLSALYRTLTFSSVDGLKIEAGVQTNSAYHVQPECELPATTYNNHPPVCSPLVPCMATASDSFFPEQKLPMQVPPTSYNSTPSASGFKPWTSSPFDHTSPTTFTFAASSPASQCFSAPSSYVGDALSPIAGTAQSQRPAKGPAKRKRSQSHQDDRPRRLDAPSYGCEWCDRISKNNSEAVKHRLQHEKPHLCDVDTCKHSKEGGGEGFATVNDCERHRKSVHNLMPRVGESSCYICVGGNYCDKSNKIWPRKDNFKQHCKRRHPEWDTMDLIERSKVLLRDVHAASSDSGYGSGLSSTNAIDGRTRICEDNSANDTGARGSSIAPADLVHLPHGDAALVGVGAGSLAGSVDSAPSFCNKTVEFDAFPFGSDAYPAHFHGDESSVPYTSWDYDEC